ncbi:hypothetical protein GCM10023093_18820 [Nemorincola caseinilytica]|uniref:10-bladed beta-propeller domain-containing protein n=2 Tax=Nemorincola caseinilytica TaxID=2054315 RepID=A0ABP8NEZ8_9BACT
MLTLSLCASAQLASYVDNQNQVMVWDKGMIRKIDFLAPTSMKIGRSAIPYLDNSRSFKVYANNRVTPVNIGFTNNYYATDNLVVFLNQKSLNVFENGEVKNLTAVCDQYFVADSVVFFLDSYKGAYKAYYKGKTYNIEGYFSDSSLASIRVTDNIVAYNNFANQFRIFYLGELIAQEDYPVSGFEVGRNTVAYVDIDRKFKVFHSGRTFVLDDFPPKSYKVGDNVVAYLTADGYFKVFYDDSARSMGFMSGNYQVVDNIVAFKDQSNYLKVFYKGDVSTIDNYYPNNMVIQYNSLAYVNYGNTLRLFSEGETYDVTNAELTNWQLNYDVLMYQMGQNMFRVFYKGTEY